MKGDCIVVIKRGGYQEKIEATKVGGTVARDHTASGLVAGDWLVFVEKNRTGRMLRRYSVLRELVESIDIRLRQGS